MAKWKYILNTDQRIDFYDFETAAQATLDVGYSFFTWGGWVFDARYAKHAFDDEHKICRTEDVG